MNLKNRNILIVILLFCSLKLSSQNSFKNSISISIPVVWNLSSAVEHSAGGDVSETGNAISYGANLQFLRKIQGPFSLKGGVGFYRQCFGILKACDFTLPGSILVKAKAYKYSCLDLLIGVGYEKVFPGSIMHVSINFNKLHSFNQDYENRSGSIKQVNKRSMEIGQTIDVSVGFTKKLSNRTCVGPTLIVPFYSHWKTDPMFLIQPKIASTQISLGFSLNASYTF